jgi:NADH-quinone oxidoreductase subunit H
MRPGPSRRALRASAAIADGLKFLFKEDVIPTNANTFLYIAAPVISLVPALLAFSVIPFGPWLQVTDLSVGLLFIFAIGSLGVYGIALGGWASNSQYPLMGAMRSCAQMIS